MARETPVTPNFSPPTNRKVPITFTAPPVREVTISRRESPAARRKEAQKLWLSKMGMPRKYKRKYRVACLSKSGSQWVQVRK